MLLDLLKNIKQAALSHALSTAIVVQGVAVQQATIDDFSVMESEILESSLEQRQQNRETQQLSDDGGSDRYWQEISEMATASDEAQIANAKSSEVLAELYEPIESGEGPSNSNQATGSSSASGVSSLIAINSNVPLVAPSVEVASGERSQSPSRSPAVAAVGSGNNLQKPSESSDSGKSVTTSSSSEGKSDVSFAGNDISSSSQSSGEASDQPSSEVANSGDASEVGADEDNGEENQEEEQEEPQSFEYLGNVFLVVDGQVSEIAITENLNLELDPLVDYSFIVSAEEDFGSVVFSLENINSLAVHNQIENMIPFALSGDTGNNNSITPYGFESASYQLDLTAFDGNGVGGEVLERRTIRFSVTFTENSNQNEGDSDD